MKSLVAQLDISSGGELLVAEEAGWSPSEMTFVGPAKMDWEIECALRGGCGHIVVESTEELVRVNEIADNLEVVCKVVLRINPKNLPKGFGVSMSQRPTIFGIDEERIDNAVVLAGQLRNLSLQGFHVYAGTQCLDNCSIVENLANTAKLFSRLSSQHDLSPSILIFGSGFGIPYHENDKGIDVKEIARLTIPIFRELKEESLAEGGHMLLEMGRFIVGECGAFVTRVLNVKETRGAQILVLDGGMNQFLGASGNLGSIIKRNYPVHNISNSDQAVQQEYDISGPLCTNIDTLGRKVSLPETRPGDILVFGCGGAYGLTASPINFITHRPPSELMIDFEHGKHKITDITNSGVTASPP